MTGAEERGHLELWSDELLIAAVRVDAPDEAALQVLVDRHWKRLYARCRVLAQSEDLAKDLAQETWYRVLRRRQSLDPSQSFSGYLTTIATNLWRDWSRSSRRGTGISLIVDRPLAAPMDYESGRAEAMTDALPDPRSISTEEQIHLVIDIDAALSRLTPQLREVVIARYVDGESAAGIGRRHGRTEQTVTGWLRQALREMRESLCGRDGSSEHPRRTHPESPSG